MSVEFSNDGTLLAAGGRDSIVRLWPIRNEAEVESGPTTAPIEMDGCRQEFGDVHCLAFAPDNRRLFSGGFGQKISIHHVET